MMQKKASDSSNLENKNTTHTDRCWNFKRFLTPLAVGTMALTARMNGVEAQPAPDSALQRKGDNTTGLIPAFNQQEFNNSTAMEFNPYTYKVTPELIDHLRKVGVKNPEQFIQNARQLEQNFQQREQKQGQRQKMRLLAEKAQKIQRFWRV